MLYKIRGGWPTNLIHCALSLTPFATASSKFDLDRTNAGILIPDQLTYARRQTTAEDIRMPALVRSRSNLDGAVANGVRGKA